MDTADKIIQMWTSSPSMISWGLGVGLIENLKRVYSYVCEREDRVKDDADEPYLGLKSHLKNVGRPEITKEI